MSEYLLPLPEAARLLGLSEKRIYQLDEELKPIKVKRGTKMVTRWYSPAQIDAYRTKHQKAPRQAPARDLDRMARDAAARHLTQYADTTPFFFGVAPEDTDKMRERVRAIAKRISKEST
jgi:predicted DNA-binding transcriptional regulator AlpA